MLVILLFVSITIAVLYIAFRMENSGIQIVRRNDWIFYINEDAVKLNPWKSGKWMYFFQINDVQKNYAMRLLKALLLSKGNVLMHQRGTTVYMEMLMTSRITSVLSISGDDDIIRKRKSDKLFNISFNHDHQIHGINISI